jgi:NADH-quinone oxidoreductase subunit C
MGKSIKQELELSFKGITVKVPENAMLIVESEKEQVLAVLKFFRDKGYAHLSLVSCVDWMEEKEFELVYILTSYFHMEEQKDKCVQKSNKNRKLHIILKTRIPRKKAEFETSIPVFKNAEPYEREIHEFFGIKFKGHPKLIPLFLEREYKIPPFRKDFDTRKYVEEVFGSISFVKEELERK